MPNESAQQAQAAVSVPTPAAPAPEAPAAPAAGTPPPVTGSDLIASAISGTLDPASALYGEGAKTLAAQTDAQPPLPGSPVPAAVATPTETPKAGDTPPEVPVAEAPPAEHTPADPEVTPEGTTEPAAEPEAAPVLPERIRTNQFDAVEQEAIQLRKVLKDRGESISLMEALQRTQAKYAPQTPASEATAPNAAPQAPTINPRAAQLESEIADLRKQMDEAGERSDLYTPELAKATQMLAEKTAELATTRLADQIQSQRSYDARVAAREAVKQEVLKEYPTAADESSLLGSMVAAEVAALLSNPNHPDRRQLEADTAPKWVVERSLQKVVANLTKTYGMTEAQALTFAKGQKATITPTAPPLAPVQDTGPKPVPRNAPVSATGTAGAPEPAPLPTPQELLQAARLNPKLAEAALSEGTGAWFS